MTFKHMKFEDSATMRSLEKLAREKGLVKPEVMTKSASSQLDLAPSSSLTENVLKLCVGLKACGFDKYADELESKFVVYKQAQTLYETSKETGDDLVHSAHPKGSHKLDGVDGEEATIETILDQHIKILEKINKTPTGKLSSASDVIKAVKKVLGQQADLTTKLSDDMKRVRQIVQRIINAAEPHLSVSLSAFQSKSFGSRASGFEDYAANPTAENLKKMQGLYKDFAYRLRPGTIVGLPQSVWTTQIEPLMNYLQATIEDAVQVRQVIDEKKAAETTEALKKEFQTPVSAPATAQPAPDAATLDAQIEAALTALDGFVKTIAGDKNTSEADKKSAYAWLNTKINAITALRSDPKQSAEKIALLQKLTSDFPKFKEMWIG